MDLFQGIALRLVLRYLESAVTPEAVDSVEAKAKAALEAYVAKTPSTVDDKVLAAVEKVLVGDSLKAVEAELMVLAASFAASTPTDFDDQVVAVLKKALAV